MREDPKDGMTDATFSLGDSDGDVILSIKIADRVAMVALSPAEAKEVGLAMIRKAGEMQRKTILRRLLERK